LPADQREWAEKQLAEFDKKLDALHDKAAATRASFTKELVQKAGEAVQAAREQVRKARDEAGGIWGRFLNALDRFLADPAKFVIEGLLEVLGIPPRDFWAVVAKIRSVISDIASHPLWFVNNLMAGVGAGFTLFFHNIGKHLLEGLLDWLLSGLEQEGITIEVPRDPTDLRSVIGFFLQLLGISWARIRKLLVAELGEKAVALIEKSVRVIQLLAAKGIPGILDEIKAMLDPKTIIDNIIQTAISFIVERLIVKVTVKILLMLNPVGAILAAIEAVYRVLKWVFHNAARIFRLIEAVVNGVADIMAGNTGGVATMIDAALARMISPVIDFLADYAGLGDLPGKVADALKGLQSWVEKGLQAVIKWLVAMGRKALSALGFKGTDDKAKPDGPAEIGTHVPFEGGGESHEIYMAVIGTDAEVMIHSQPKTVEKWLNEREKDLDDKDKSAKIGQERARDLIAEARKLNAETRKAASIQVAKTKAAPEAQGASTSPAGGKTAVNTVEQEERPLAVVLKEIADLFGTPAPAQPSRGPEVWEEISQELSLDPATDQDTPADVAAAAQRARASGLTGPPGQAGQVDLAVQPHRTAPEARAGQDVSGKDVQSAHIGPTSFLRDQPGYSRGGADTVLLDKATHAAFDKYWKDWAIAERHAGRTTTEVSKLYSVMLDAIGQIPGLQQRTKNAMVWRLHLELFRDLQLAPTDIVSLPYPKSRRRYN
jgi:hypothetical protein